MDYLGVNWYNADTFFGMDAKNPCKVVNDLGWDMRPAQIEIALSYLSKKYNLPIMITENGCADAGDTRRKWWIDETIKAIKRAQNNGVKMLGYLHWSAFDNFEWDKGFWPRFGLIKVDLSTKERTIRDSAKWYGSEVKRYRGL
jgi:beta-glucosidase